MIKAITDAIKVNQGLRAELEKTEDALSFEDLTNQVENFGGAWSRTGSVIIDTFGGISDSINDYMKQLESLDKQQSKIDENRKKDGADLVALNKLEQKVTDNRILAELKGLGALSKAGSSLFSEKTAAAKAFAALSKIIAIAEIALSFQKMAASTTEAGVHVVNETIKQGSNSLTAITAAFAAPWPIGFIAGAAMIGIMASLLGGSSGGGGGAVSQEGSAADQPEASSSITDASDRILEIEIDQLAELKGIRDGITAVQTGSSQLARLLSGGGAGIGAGIGAGGGERSIKLSSLIDLKDLGGMPLETRLDEVIAEAMEFAFGTATVLRSISDGISNTVKSAVDILGVSIRGSLDGFLLNVDDVDLAGLTLEEATDKISGAFSDQSDVLVALLIPAISDYQVANEGLFDTLIRVSKEQAIFNDVIDQIGISLTSLSSIMKIDVAQSVISLIGGLEIFSDLTSEFFSEFFSEEEQFEQLSKSLNEAVKTLGISMFDSRNQFRAMIEGLDLTTIAGQKLFAGLLELVPAFDDFFDSVEESERKLIDQRNKTIKASFSMIEKSIALEKQRASAVLDVAKIANKAELDRISDLRLQLNAENELRKQAIVESESVLNLAFNAEILAIQNNASVRISALNNERSALDATASSMRSLVSNINSSLGLSGGQNLISALAGARRGAFGAAQALDVRSLTNLDASQFSSAEALAVQEAINRNRLSEISKLAGGEVARVETASQAINRQIAATQAASDTQVEQLSEQLNALLGIDTGVLSIDEAIVNFKESQASLDQLNFDKEIEKLDMMLQSANEVFALHEQGYADELERLDELVSNNKLLLDAALGIDNSVLSVAEAIVGLNESIAAIPAAVAATAAASAESARESNEAILQSINDSLNEAQDENREIQMVILRNSNTTARALQTFKLDGIDTREIK